MTSVDQTSISIRRMSTADILTALRLCRLSGWNQLNEDWQRLIAYDPDGCFVATCDGQIAGTVTTTGYGHRLGWIGMMLVDPDFRRLGIATALMRQSIEYLKSRQVRCIRLDATPDGELVYTKLEFKPEWTFHRWSREGSADEAQTELPCATSCLPDDVLELDQRAFGADRREFLNLLVRGSFAHVTRDGFGMLRPGFLASYLGPVTARTPAVAESMIGEICRRTDGSVFWDIPASNKDAIRIARSLGFAPTRDFTRMALGGVCSSPDLRLQYALADPGTG